MEKLVDEESYLCDVCEKYVYSEKRGEPLYQIPAGTPFEMVSAEFRCPDCGAQKCEFVPVHQVGWMDGTVDSLCK